MEEAQKEPVVGRWSDEEHAVFVDFLQKHGRNWKLLASLIPSRTVVQIRTHAQKFFQKLEKQPVVEEWLQPYVECHKAYGVAGSRGDTLLSRRTPRKAGNNSMAGGDGSPSSGSLSGEDGSRGSPNGVLYGLNSFNPRGTPGCDATPTRGRKASHGNGPPSVHGSTARHSQHAITWENAVYGSGGGVGPASLIDLYSRVARPGLPAHTTPACSPGGYRADTDGSEFLWDDVFKSVLGSDDDYSTPAPTAQHHRVQHPAAAHPHVGGPSSAVGVAAPLPTSPVVTQDVVDYLAHAHGAASGKKRGVGVPRRGSIGGAGMLTGTGTTAKKARHTMVHVPSQPHPQGPQHAAYPDGVPLSFSHNLHGGSGSDLYGGDDYDDTDILPPLPQGLVSPVSNALTGAMTHMQVTTPHCHGPVSRRMFTPVVGGAMKREQQQQMRALFQSNLSTLLSDHHSASSVKYEAAPVATQQQPCNEEVSFFFDDEPTQAAVPQFTWDQASTEAVATQPQPQAPHSAVAEDGAVIGEAATTGAALAESDPLDFLSASWFEQSQATTATSAPSQPPSQFDDTMPASSAPLHDFNPILFDMLDGRMV